MEESFLKVVSSGKGYYLRIKYNKENDCLISIEAVDGGRSWYGEGTLPNVFMFWYVKSETSFTEVTIDTPEYSSP